MANLDARRNERICKLVRRLTPRGGSVLEVSCGKGEVLEMIQHDGYRVRGTNFTTYLESSKDVPIDAGVDFMEGLPHEDASFDAVLMLDIIEHVNNHESALRHAVRVLKKGGHLIVATPNLNNLSSRLHFLMTGFFKVRRSFIGFDVSPDKAFAFHNCPAYLPVFLYQMHAHRVPCTGLDVVGYKLKTVGFWLLFCLPILLMTLHRTHRQEKFLAGTTEAKYCSNGSRPSRASAAN